MLLAHFEMAVNFCTVLCIVEAVTNVFRKQLDSAKELVIVDVSGIATSTHRIA